MTKLMLVALDLDKELRVKVDVLDYPMGGVLLCHIPKIELNIYLISFYFHL